MYGNWVAVTNIMGLSVEINNRGANTPCPTKEKRTRWHKTKRKIWYSSGKWKQNFKLPCIKSTKKNVYERRSKKCDNEILRSRTHSQHTQNLSRSIRWYIMSGICINFFLHTILLSFFPTFAIWMESAHIPHPYTNTHSISSAHFFPSVNFVEV